MRERPLYKKSLDSSDVFILDLGLEVFQVSQGCVCVDAITSLFAMVT